MSKKKRRKLDLMNNTSGISKAFSSKNFSPHHLVNFTPKTHPQRQFFESYAQGIPLILQVGSAGTGKTAVAMWAGLRDVFDKDTPYDRLIIVRSAVQAREIGFLPGGMDGPDSKNAAYETPYKALCDELLTFKTNNYDNLKAKGMVEFHNTSFLRGQTFDRAVILVDEFQSMTYHELSTITTRCGLHSRLVFCGDFKQNDLTRRNDKSGFHDFMQVIQKMPSEMVDIVNYQPRDIIRSGLCKEFLLAEEMV